MRDRTSKAFVRAHTAPDTPVRETGGDIWVGRRGSLSVRLDSGMWFDHEAGKGDDVSELVRALTGDRDFPDTLRRIADFAGTGAGVPGSIAPVRPCSRARLKAMDTRAVAAMAERLESEGSAVTIRTSAALGADFVDLVTRGSVTIGSEAAQ